MRRDLSATALVAVTLLTIVPAYDRVFSAATWRGPALAAALSALVLASLTRRLDRGAWVAGLVSILGFLAAAPWLLGQSARPVLPSLSVIGGLFELLAVGRVELAETPAPTLPLAGLMLLVIGGWWLIAHVAHELYVRWRRPGLALAVLTVLWASPLAVPLSDQSSWSRALPFLGMACLTLLLTGSEEVPHELRTPVPFSGVALGAGALAIGLTMPGLLPGYAEPAWIQLGAGSSPRGYQPIVDVSQRLQLPDERDVLRVLASQRTYLRLAGLESFDGDVWRLGPPGSGSYRPDHESLHVADKPLPPEHRAASTKSVQVRIEVLELANIYVPVPYQPIEVFGPTRDEMIWSTEGGFLATLDTVEDEVDGEPRVGITQGVEYRVEAARPAPTFDQLLTTTPVDDATLERFTKLPRDYPELGDKAEEVYEAAGATTTVEQALALQDWFVGPDGGFTYDLDVPALRGDDALTDFVLEDRVGYCEYFATAMAVMLRQTGIPARVATGFLPGQVTAEADPAAGIEFTEYTVSTADAHAWVEVLFPDAGWVTFEPTPRDDDSHILPTENDLAPIENMAERRQREAEESADDPAPNPTVPDTPNIPEADLQGPSATGDQADEGSGSTGEDRSAWLLLVAVVPVMIVTWLIVRRRRDDRGPDRTPQRRVLDAQRDLLATAARHGVGRGDHETTVELVERWRSERRIDERGVPVAVAAQAAAFGGTVATSQAEEVERLAAEMEQMLRDSVTPRDRLIAPLRLPLTRGQQWVLAAAERLVQWRAGA